MLAPLIGAALLGSALVVVGVALAGSASRQVPSSHNLTIDSVNGAEWGSKRRTTPALLIKLQVLLDRAHASPGQIDAKLGEDTRKAIAAWREMRNLPASDRVDEQVWRALTENDREPPLVTYTITEDDVAGPFIAKVPKDFREKARLKQLAYTSARELLADPTYQYDPSLKLRGVDVKERLKLPPGPNNPVGVVWIALSAKGYGIHGTPDPEAVGKRASHGCIRLTNWDAWELSRHVNRSTPVNVAGQKGGQPARRRD